MQTDQPLPASVDDYIAAFPAAVQESLGKIRAAIRQAVPDAQEAIKYQIPTYSLKGNLISFAAYKAHIALYPAPAGDEPFRQAAAPYRSGKSTLKFPLDRPLPFDLIHQAIAFRLQEHLARAAAR